MAGRTSRRAALALLGAILALGGVLFPTGTGASTPAAHVAATVHAAARPLPATATRPGTPVARTAHVALRFLGYADPAAGAPAMPMPLLTAALGLGSVVAVSGRSRLSHDRRRPRGPPAPLLAA